MCRKAARPRAIQHAIEQGPWTNWPTTWRRVVYSGWRELEVSVDRSRSGRRVAMEDSPGDAVPYLDLVPAGVLGMVRQAGAVVVSSGDLVSQPYAAWDAPHLAAHRRAAQCDFTEDRRDAIRVAGERASTGSPLTEYAIQDWIFDRMARAGLVTVLGRPIVATGRHAADPHYRPTQAYSDDVGRGEVLLIDLWASEPGRIPSADQTWMGVLGNADAGRSARGRRCATPGMQRSRCCASGRQPADRCGRGSRHAARAVIESRGYRPVLHAPHGPLDRPARPSRFGPHLDNPRVA